MRMVMYLKDNHLRRIANNISWLTKTDPIQLAKGGDLDPPSMTSDGKILVGHIDVARRSLLFLRGVLLEVPVFQALALVRSEGGDGTSVFDVLCEDMGLGGLGPSRKVIDMVRILYEF